MKHITLILSYRHPVGQGRLSKGKFLQTNGSNDIKCCKFNATTENIKENLPTCTCSHQLITLIFWMNAYIQSPKPYRMKDHVIDIEPLWRSADNKVPLDQLNPPLQLQILARGYRHQYLLKVWYL